MARQLRHGDYTVGWVCALPVELAAARIMLDEKHQDLERGPADNDDNLYNLGSIRGHNVVLGCLPAGRIGTNSAAAVATQMRATFKAIRFGLMVGIGGGVPSDEYDIRLGDVVVSQPRGMFAGVVQYDAGKTTPSGFERTGVLDSPPRILLAAVAQVQTNMYINPSKLREHIAELESVSKFQRNKAGPDVLFEATYDHKGGQTCIECSVNRQKPRQLRDSDEEVMIHYGTIASGNQVMRSAADRDKVSAELGGVLCFEMEAAGLMNSFPCLVIRGVCDYADSHKNKQWQAHAAGTAAAYAKEVLSMIPAEKIAEIRTAEEAIRETIGPQKEIKRPLEKRATTSTLAIRTNSLDQDERNEPQFGCEGCERKFRQKEAVNQHVTGKEDHWPRFKCRKCGAEFGSDEAAHEHRRAKLHWTPNISCQMCPRKFTTLAAAQNHLHAQKHRGLIMACKMCVASFKTEQAAERHMKDKNHLVL